VDLGPHTSFILAAYAVATAVVLTLVVWVIIDYRAQCRWLAELERRGITRKSFAQPSSPP
jgi:heme exporter protein D